jgi:hypothetical protein
VTTEFQAQALLNQLMAVRAERLALLLTTFPPTHWLTIALAVRAQARLEPRRSTEDARRHTRSRRAAARARG